MRIQALFIALALCACSEPSSPSAPARDPNAPYEPPLAQMTGEQPPETIADARTGHGKWFRRSGDASVCPATLTNGGINNGRLLRAESNEWTSNGYLHEVDGTYTEGEPNELRWTEESGEARFAWIGQYGTLLGPGERRCEYSRSFVWGERSPLLP